MLIYKISMGTLTLSSKKATNNHFGLRPHSVGEDSSLLYGGNWGQIEVPHLTDNLREPVRMNSYRLIC